MRPERPPPTTIILFSGLLAIDILLYLLLTVSTVLHYEVAAHESKGNEAENGTEGHAQNADDILDARPFGNAPGHAERRDTIAEMEDRGKHAEDVEHGNGR